MNEHPTRRDVLLAGAAALPLAAAARAAGAPPVPALPFRTAGALAEALRRRELSSVEATKLALERIARLEPSLNAWANVLEASALAEARKADAALRSRRVPGPLLGVPVAIKDAHGIAGVPTTAGAEFLKDHRPAADSAVVERLRAAGAVVLGNTIVPLMLGDWQSFNPMHGTANNPWDAARTPGGSSGGSAAAVAAGMAWLATGSDIGGSIRVPAHFCGIYGHKPTIGLVPDRGHVPPPPGVPPQPAPDLPVSGPLARSAADLRLAMGILGGPDGDDAVAYRWTMPAPRHRRLRDFRVGVVLDDPACPVSAEVRAPLEAAVEALRRAGATVTTAGWPAGTAPADDFWTYFYLLMATVSGPTPPERREALRAAAASPERTFETMTARAQAGTLADWQREQSRRLRVRAAWQAWFRDHDVMLLPTAFAPAIPHMQGPERDRVIATPEGPRPYVDLMWWIVQATLAGLPATTAPVGRTASGLPVGIQIVGPYLEDGTPIRFAELLAEVAGGYEVPPVES